MSESGPGDPPEGGEASLQELARDWITLWQSELAALAVDREAVETWQSMVALWAGAAGAMLNGVPSASGQGDRADGRAGAAAASRPAPAAAASDPRDAEIERLVGRVAELEQRLALLERAELERRGDRGRRRRA